MAFLKDKDRQEVQKEFARLQKNVTLKVFTQEMECDFCSHNRELIEEVGALSDKITVEVLDFQKDKDQADTYHIDQIPATVVEGDQDYGIRFYGISSGYEFVSLMEAIKMVSTGDSGLSAATRDYLKSLDKDVHMQVFVTPTCPYCPGMVILAHQMALESPRVTADMVEATEFPHLSIKYQVMGVPRTVINEDHFVEGRVPEQQFLSELQDILK